MNRQPPTHFVLLLSACLFCLCSLAAAKDHCDTEIKLLLDPAGLQATLNALGAGPPTARRVYLFDTKNLQLLSRDVILRVRQGGKTSDVMVKVRVTAQEKLPVHDLGDGFKCEIDRAGNTADRSYSVLASLKDDVPDSGGELAALLSSTQKQLLDETQVSPDWSHIKKIVTIDSTTWQLADEPGLPKLALELWQWPHGQVLELSTRASHQGDITAERLKQLVAEKGLSLRAAQEQKTDVVRESLPQSAGR